MEHRARTAVPTEEAAREAMEPIQSHLEVLKKGEDLNPEGKRKACEFPQGLSQPGARRGSSDGGKDFSRAAKETQGFCLENICSKKKCGGAGERNRRLSGIMQKGE
ncbi:von Willebrand factor A domain-containing protein 1 [Platysternon megacephalum]|uniref:von Willebrand factor A domain-containing protein 1 n=1 Tax=Platysternon megacephalum TaxID=55544 RepID=A0A4D9F955_9SAUR|nr:von Willebrand factor A domain-containing protein 1 [Platysternon megacephalum]